MASTFYNKIEWMTSPYLVPYEEAVLIMQKRTQAIACHQAPECIWLLEHPPVFTLGTSGQEKDILDKSLPIYKTGRGGKVTFHGPGQRVVYTLLDLRRQGQDLKRFIKFLETWILLTLGIFSLKGFTTPERIGVWVKTPRGEEKIAAIGIRVRKWVSFHGFALNVHPDLKQFEKIVPCGLSAFKACSLASVGIKATMAQVDEALQQTFDEAWQIC